MKEEKHRIETMRDLVTAASPENIAVLAADLEAWLRIHIEVAKLPGVTMDDDVFVWTDDGRAEVRKINITVDSP